MKAQIVRSARLLLRGAAQLPPRSRKGLAKGREFFMWSDRWSGAVIGAAIEVHRHLGPGLLESAYEMAMALEFDTRGIPYVRQKPVPIRYRELVLDTGLRLDIVIGEELVVELKSVEALTDLHRAQLLTYLRFGAYPVGLLINFNVPVLRQGIKRLVNNAPE